MNCIKTILLPTLFFITIVAAADIGKIVWVNWDGFPIGQCKLDGSNSEVVVLQPKTSHNGEPSEDAYMRAIAFDMNTNDIFVSGFTPIQTGIDKLAKVDNEGVAKSIANIEAHGLTLWKENKELLFTDYDKGEVLSMPITGYEKATRPYLISDGFKYPIDCVFSRREDQIFVAQEAKIVKVSLESGEKATIVDFTKHTDKWSFCHFTGVSLDDENRILYFSCNSKKVGGIYSVMYDGSGLTEIREGAVEDVVYHSKSKTLYFSANGIFLVRPDGTGFKSICQRVDGKSFRSRQFTNIDRN